MVNQENLPPTPNTADLDQIIHAPARLNIMMLLYVVESLDYDFLKNQTDLSWGNLATHLGKLEEAGYIEIHKGYQGKKPTARSNSHLKAVQLSRHIKTPSSSYWMIYQNNQKRKNCSRSTVEIDPAITSVTCSSSKDKARAANPPSKPSSGCSGSTSSTPGKIKAPRAAYGIHFNQL